ncbi:MAG: hypothetical protein QMC81_11565 [Thermoanaerobacterales bacterium]|nr:hypothetical protein [Thermoanaerobacterales bacterium]
MRRVNVFIVLVAAVLALAAAAPAFAEAGLPEATADDVATRLVDVGKEILMPLGAVCIFVAIAWTAFKLIITANKPEERAQAMSAIPYILGGGVGLGATLLFAGFLVGLMKRVGGA